MALRDRSSVSFLQCFDSDSESECLLPVQTLPSYKLNQTTLRTPIRQTGIMVEVTRVTRQLRTVEKPNVSIDTRLKGKISKRAGNLDYLLLSAVDETMKQVFREEGTKVIYDYLESNSHLKHDEIAEKTEVFSADLKKLLGSGAIMIEKMILTNLYRKLGLNFPKKKGHEFPECIRELKEKYACAELKEAQEQLLKSERLAAIGEVATMVGHDLRNPLQSIENAAYYLNHELQSLSPSASTPHKATEMLKVITDSVEYADKILRDLQDFSATKKPIIKKINVNSVVSDALSQVEATENVQLVTELDQLPRIEADKDMIKRIFLNLAVNGVQAMKNGGTLKVSTKKTKGFVEVSFVDTGIGMSKENTEKIFAPLFTTKAKGMGMGLAICWKFVNAHGGGIDVESEEGKGSTFTVKLPILQESGGENK